MACVGLFGTAFVMGMLCVASKGWLLDPPRDELEAWSQAAHIYFPLWCLNGFLQSLGFPNLVAVTSGWVDADRRGLILGGRCRLTPS